MISYQGGGRIKTFLRLMRKYDYYSNRKGLINYVKHAWYSMRFFRLGTKLGFSISPTSFGYGLVIPHNGTIVVGGKNKIGNYAVLHTSTCIASTDNIIGDGLYLATGGKIVKNVILGDNVSIAANSVVNKSAKNGNCLLVGSPAVSKMQSVPWWVRDGEKYKKRHDRIEELKKIYF